MMILPIPSEVSMPGDLAPPLAVGFLGAGQMATALAAGWARAGLLDSQRSRAADPVPAARQRFEQATGVRAVGTKPQR